MLMLYEIESRMKRRKNQTILDGKYSFTYSEVLNFISEFTDELKLQKYGILCESELFAGKALLACMKNDITAVMLSRRYGEKYNEKIIENAKLSHVITDEGGELNIKQIAEVQPEPEDLTNVALIMHTSGTTGTPKGVMLSYENILLNLYAIKTYFKIDSSDTIFIPRPLCHLAVLTGEFLYGLYKGAKIIFCSQDFNAANLLKELHESKATIMAGTPTIFYHLSKMKLRYSQELCLKKIVLSGECMTAETAKIIRQAFPYAEIYNVYGLTEHSPRVSALPPEKFDEYPTSVGNALPGIWPIVRGDELMLLSRCAMKGYYNNPKLTAKTINSGTWLFTGDIAEIDEDGLIYIKSRKDDMIIRAGMNIYPQNIEKILVLQDGIEDVFAYGVRGDITQKICVEVVTCLTRGEVMKICKNLLPKTEWPDEIKIVEKIKLNASGKKIKSEE